MLLTNFHLLDGTGTPPRSGLVLLIREGNIAAIDTELTVPGEEVLDLGGRTLMPGLIDLHVHLGGGYGPDEPQMRGEPAIYEEKCSRLLDWGVTAVRTGGDYETAALAFRDSLRRGEPRAPRLFVCGRGIQAPGGHPVGTVWSGDEEVARQVPFLMSDPDQAEPEVARQAALGADHIKAFLCGLDELRQPPVARLDVRALTAVAEAAHRRGLKLMVHCDTPEDGVLALQAGADTVEHLVNFNCPAAPVPKRLEELLLQTGSWYIPTLAIRDMLGPQVPGSGASTAYLTRVVTQLYRAGVNLAVGTDSGVNGVPVGEATHRELALLAELGIPNLQVLRMATQLGARALGRSDFGTVEIGKAADLIALDGDPAAHITDTGEVALVLRRGRVLRRRR